MMQFCQCLAVGFPQSVAVIPEAPKMVSSANILICILVSVAKSFVYTRKRSGPSIDPWGTPALIVIHEDSTPHNATLCLPVSKIVLEETQEFFFNSQSFQLVEQAPMPNAIERFGDIYK